MQAISAGYVGVAIFGVVFSLVAAFYYLRVAKTMYFEEPEEDAQPIEAASDVRLLVTVNGIALLALGIVPGWLLEYCLRAFA